MPKPWSKTDVSSSSSSSATYLFTVNLVDITSCFERLAAAGDDKLDRTSKIPSCLINETRQKTLRYFQFSMFNLV